MDKQDLEIVFIEVMNEARQQSWFPRDTGFMAFTAFRGVWLSENTFKIYVDESVAPYVVYTNEAWQRGQNPNEGWFNKLFHFVGERTAVKLGGKIS